MYISKGNIYSSNKYRLSKANNSKFTHMRMYCIIVRAEKHKFQKGIERESKEKK